MDRDGQRVTVLVTVVAPLMFVSFFNKWGKSEHARFTQGELWRNWLFLEIRVHLFRQVSSLENVGE